MSDLIDMWHEKYSAVFPFRHISRNAAKEHARKQGRGSLLGEGLDFRIFILTFRGGKV